MAESRGTHSRLSGGTAAAALLLTAAVSLTVFYYFARTDTIGVWTPARGWTGMTGSARSVPVYAVLSAVLLGVVPVWVSKRVLRCSLTDLGLGLGDWRKGMLLLVGGLPLAVLAGWIASRSPQLAAVYPLATTRPATGFVPYALVLFLYFGAWEVLFRGVLLFGLAKSLGEWPAIGSETALSMTAHFGRAFGETAAALPSGIVFGWLNLRIGSLWYIAIVHWVVGVSLEWFIGW